MLILILILILMLMLILILILILINALITCLVQVPYRHSRANHQAAPRGGSAVALAMEFWLLLRLPPSPE